VPINKERLTRLGRRNFVQSAVPFAGYLLYKPGMDKVLKILNWATFATGMTAVGGMAAAILSYRLGIFQIKSAFSLLMIGGVASIAALILGLVAVGVRFYLGSAQGLALVISGMLLGALIAVPLLRFKNAVMNLPRIHDITTDVENPPQFVAILPLRAQAPNSAEYGGKAIAEQQLKAYPQIRSKILPKRSRDAFDLALKAVQALNLEVVSADSAANRIEATDTSSWFGFKDDVIIRIIPQGESSRLDIRSVSRVGLSDIGKNAERIQKLLSLIE
jgi:uncharacterized protein (DUF1499 family)